jgi:hypothetical protein
MRVALILFAIGLGCLAQAQTVRFSGKLPACTATPPSQATAAGYHTLVMCNAMTDNSQVDRNATTNPWFQWYATGFGYAMSSGVFSNDGTGMSISTSPGNGGGPYTVDINSAGNIVSGNYVTGGYYAEITATFNPATCQQAPNSWPAAVWAASPASFIAGAGGSEFVEIDSFEWLNCQSVAAVHDWSGSGVLNCTNSDAVLTYTPDSNPHVYGMLFITTTSGGGTGTISHYIDNVLQNTLTYTTSGKPDPAGTCGNGAFSTADTQQWAFALQAGTGVPVKYSGFHVWQAP